MLYDQYKVELTESDLIKIITSTYLKEKATLRFFRERLFEKIAKKALE